MSSKDKPIRHKLTSTFLQNAPKTKNHSLLGRMLNIAEKIRSRVLLPASQSLETIEIERKDTGEMRGADAKTVTIKTDNECEQLAENGLRKAYPDAVILGEENFGKADAAEKLRMLNEAVTTDKMVFLVDALDGTRDFRNGNDGYAVMITAIQDGKVLAAVAYRCTDHADPLAYGHTLTFADDDRVRFDGHAVKSLTERKFLSSAENIRGYAGFEFIAAARGKDNGFPNLAGKFDSLSDCWTCSKMYGDLLRGEHHFMLVPPPADLFDYPAGIALIQQAGGVVRFLDGTDASFAEIVKRQPFGRADANGAYALDNTLVFSVSEDVFNTVQKTVKAAMNPAPSARPPVQKP